MNIIIHYPSDDNKKLLEKDIAKVYAEAVFNRVNKLNCSKEEKLRILNHLKQ